jgi:AP-2 complex subunit alpha
MPGTAQECQQTFRYARPITAESVTEMGQRLAAFKLAVLDKLDPNPLNLVCAGLLITSASQSHILVRVESAPAQQLLRLTVRSTNEAVLAAVTEMFKTHLSY